MVEMTMADTEVLEFTATTKASPEAVYNAFTNEVALREWLADYAFVRARENGFIFVAWNQGDYHAAGRYLTVDEPNEVAFSWQGSNDPGPSEVRVTIEADGDGSRFTLKHTLGSGDAWADTIKETQHGWETALENLVSNLDDRVDLRIARRPFLGIILGGIDDATQARLGLPNQDGIRITDTVEGTGAAAAGLQNDDILVGMKGKPVTNGRDLTAILATAKAGDTVDIDVIRGGETITLPLLLSKRPFPEVPVDGADFGKQMRAIYDGVNEQLSALLDGVTEEETAFRPGEGEWSVKHVLAHMLMTEQGNHAWFGTVTSNNELLNFPNANTEERIAAKLAVYPTTAELLDALRKAWDETVAILTYAPDSFVKRRTFARAAEGFLFGPLHEQVHLQQIREALEAARS